MLDCRGLSSSWLVRRWYVTVLVVLLPLWGWGMLTRVAWTPDEPRELSLCAAMQRQADKVVPELAGVPFCEKPPLTYWLGAASLELFGHTAPAARVPNLLYALVGTLAVGALAGAMVRSSPGGEPAADLAALVAALALGTMELSWQVQIWLASDAPLLAGVAVALWGAWRALAADTTRARLGWWCVFHLGLIVGFMAKNIAGWLVPWSAVAVYLLWQGRWREWLRWELHVGWALHGLLLGPWVLAVARHAEGGRLLRIFFWDNLVGRFLPVASEGRYLTGHQNTIGSYATGLPGFLAPWTFVGLAALLAVGVAAWRREAVARFLAAAMVPVFLLLSVSHTGRGIYLVIIFPAVAVALGWWWVRQGAVANPAGVDRWALRLNLFLGLVLTLILGLLVALAPWLFDLGYGGGAWALLVVILGLSAAALVVAMRRWRQQQWAGALGWTGGALWIALLAALAIGIPQVNPWQDQTIITHRVAQTAVQTPVLLFQPDETIVAQLDWHVQLRLTAVEDAAAARQIAAAHPATLFLAKINSDRLPSAFRDKLAQLVRPFGGKIRERTATSEGPKADALQAAGFECVERIGVPAGRRYGLFRLRATSSPVAR